MEPRAEGVAETSRERYGAESRKPTHSIKIGNACIKIWSRKPSQCIRIGNACIKIRNRVFSAQFSVL